MLKIGGFREDQIVALGILFTTCIDEIKSCVAIFIGARQGHEDGVQCE